MVELGVISERERQEFCILLAGGMYGNPDAALRYNIEYKEHVKDNGMEQSRADPCVFYKKDQEGKLVLATAGHVDDNYVVGTKDARIWYKSMLGTRFKYTEEGILRKLLGVWYEKKQDPETGEYYLVATMPKMVRDIIDQYEKHVQKEAKLYETLGTPGLVLEKNAGPTIDGEKFRSIVGKYCFLTQKIFPEGCNTAREFSRHLSNPGEAHWKELGKVVGYLKFMEKDIKLIFRKPIELRPGGEADSNWATDKTDRKSVSGGIVTWWHVVALALEDSNCGGTKFD
jgi:hypothetical protein